jgi:hypothetical protein
MSYHGRTTNYLWIWFLTIILKWENHGAKLCNLLSNLPRSTWIRFHVWLDFYLLFINWLSFLHVSTYLKNNFFLTFFKLLFQTHLRLNRLLYYKNKDKYLRPPRKSPPRALVHRIKPFCFWQLNWHKHFLLTIPYVCNVRKWVPKFIFPYTVPKPMNSFQVDLEMQKWFPQIGGNCS